MAVSAAPGAASPRRVPGSRGPPGSSSDPAPAAPLPFPSPPVTRRTRGQTPTCESSLCSRARSRRGGGPERGTPQEGRAIWIASGRGSRRQAVCPGFACKWAGWGDESSSPSTPSFLHPLDGSFGRPDAWLRLSRGVGVRITLGSQTCVLHLARETRPQRKDRWSQRPTRSWGQDDCKEGKAELGKTFAKPREMCDTQGANHALLCRAATQRRVSVLSLPSATENDDNRFGVRTLFYAFSAITTFQDVLRCRFMGRKMG